MSLQSSQSKRNDFHSLNFWVWVKKKIDAPKKIKSLDIKFLFLFGCANRSVFLSNQMMHS